MITKLNEIEAFILTGGQSRRFGGPKCLAKINNITLTEIVYDNLNTSFKKISIVGKYNHFPNLSYIEDTQLVQCPMNGIASTLKNSNSEWIFVIGCDMPQINSKVINYLFENITADRKAVIPYNNDKLQTLCTFYHRSILDDLKRSINKNEYSLFKLLNRLDITKIAIPMNLEKQFLNINYYKDLEKLI